MIYTSLPEDNPHRLPFYLAMEEYLARYTDMDECFFMWQVSPTVIFGRNQLIDSEVNIKYCNEHHIEIYRRKSGGGCVYADMGNVMLSYITHETNVNLAYNSYVNLIILALLKMGITATVSGRNDILIDNKKVSGSAFYHLKNRSIIHGTMLYDTHMEHMLGSITPEATKLTSKGVKSVRQRITLLKNHTDMSLAEFMRNMRNSLCNREIVLDEAAVRQIEEIEKGYYSKAFIYDNNPRHTIIRQRRIVDVGLIEVRLTMSGDSTIKDADITGDFFTTGDLHDGILRHLRGASLTHESLSALIPSSVHETIPHLTKEQLIDTILTPS